MLSVSQSTPRHAGSSSPCSEVVPANDKGQNSKRAPEKKGGKEPPPKEEVKPSTPALEDFLKKEYKSNPIKTFKGLLRKGRSSWYAN